MSKTHKEQPSITHLFHLDVKLMNMFEALKIRKASIHCLEIFRITAYSAQHLYLLAH